MTEIEEMIESMEDILNQEGGWILPNRGNSLIFSKDGHLSVIHTSLLRKWLNTLRTNANAKCDRNPGG
jgi:hypothetical protein